MTKFPAIEHLQDIKAKTFVWINMMRRFYMIGEPLLDLPKGIPGAYNACPVAKGLSNSDKRILAHVSGEQIIFYIYQAHTRRIELMDSIATPDYIHQFQHYFDKERYSELIYCK